jgi:diadenylate cyclase
MINYLIDLARSFRVVDFFDITVISILTYVVLIWFKKTASRFVLIGISILGLIYIFAHLFQMYLTVFVLQGFFAILLIAMVIIFQEDLRRFFERLAMWGVIRKKRSSVSSHKDIDVLTLTATNLARRRFGALIVLKGNDPLDRHLKGGIPLEGKLSEPLLQSIFDPHSIGHDGAVIIEDGQVVKFGCHLPLSLNTRKIGELGLRHTAALGLAELSDALCIVVSEERGTITVARDERLKKLDSPDELKSILEHFYKKRSPKATKKTWQDWVRENSREKAIAVLLTCGLWLTFGYQTGNVRRDFVVPIEYRNLASDWIIEEPKPKEATVTLMGPEQAFDFLNPQVLKISLDMSKIQEGEQGLVLEQVRVRHPSNLSVVGIEPNKIQLIAHQIIPIDVPIKVQTSGKLPPGLTLRQIVVSPKSIQVMALSKGKKHIQILTEPINLQDITTTSMLTPKLVLPEDIQFVNNKPPAVQVTIEIEKQKTRKER